MKIKSTLLASVYSRRITAAAYDTRGSWKKDADGKLATDDKGNPVWIDGDGKELVTEGTTIARIQGEAKTHREAKEAAETKLKAFEGLDADAARKAIDTVGKIDAKTLIDAGKVDEVRTEVSKTFQTQLDAQKAALEAANARGDTLTRQLAFKGSEFLRDRIAVPADMVEATYGGNFKVEDGKIVPYDQSGNKIYSDKRAGEIASVDEAFEKLISTHPHKDAILRAPDAKGSGGGSGGERGKGRVIKRADFDGMSSGDQAALAEQMGKGEVQIVD